MIDRVSGTVLDIELAAVVVDVGGVAFRVEVTQPCAESLQRGAKATLLTQFMLLGQDPQPKLFGFRSPGARQLFLLLRKVSGIGASTALRILGAQPTPEGVAAAIAREDVAGIKVKGVGPKTAKRVISELKEKVGAVLACLPDLTASQRRRRPASTADRPVEDAFLALKGLEYDPVRARALLEAIREEKAEATADELVREVLLRG
jgi:Holliday junction DNA helicase RuvA